MCIWAEIVTALLIIPSKYNIISLYTQCKQPNSTTIEHNQDILWGFIDAF